MIKKINIILMLLLTISVALASEGSISQIYIYPICNPLPYTKFDKTFIEKLYTYLEIELVKKIPGIKVFSPLNDQNLRDENIKMLSFLNNSQIWKITFIAFNDHSNSRRTSEEISMSLQLEISDGEVLLSSGKKSFFLKSDQAITKEEYMKSIVKTLMEIYEEKK